MSGQDSTASEAQQDEGKNPTSSSTEAESSSSSSSSSSPSPSPPSSHVFRDRFKIPPGCCKVKWALAEGSGGFKETIKLDVTLRNFSLEPIPQTRLWWGWDTDSYAYFDFGMHVCEEPIEPYKERTITIEVEPKDKKVNIERLAHNQVLLIEAYDPTKGNEEMGGKHLASIQACLSFQHYQMAKYLQAAHPLPKGCKAFNIALMGYVGAGKTSLLQTLGTMLSSDPEDMVIQNMAAVGGAGNHVTNNIAKYTLIEGYLNAFDTFGIERKTYQNPDITTKFIQGGLPEFWDREDELDCRTMEKILKTQAPTQDERRIHGVIFVVPSGCLEDDEDLELCRKVMNTIKQQGINPVVLLGRTDKQCETIRHDTMDWEALLDEDLNQVAEKFGIPRARVFPAVPYVTERRRKWGIDCLAFQILEQVIRDCEMFLKYGDRTTARLENGSKPPTSYASPSPGAHTTSSSPTHEETDSEPEVDD